MNQILKKGVLFHVLPQGGSILTVNTTTDLITAVHSLQIGLIKLHSWYLIVVFKVCMKLTYLPYCYLCPILL